MLKCSFTYGQIEELLAVLHRIAPERRVAFQGRLKHLQRWDFPTGTKPGKGKAISYTIEHVFKMVIALELIQSGIPPKLAVDLTEGNWTALRATVFLNTYSASERQAGGTLEGDWFWIFRPETMRAMTVEGESEYDHYEAVEVVKEVDFPAYFDSDNPSFDNHMGASWRTLVINGGRLVKGIVTLLSLRFEWVTKDDVRSDLLDVMDAERKMIEDGRSSIEASLRNWQPTERKYVPVAMRYPSTVVDEANAIILQQRELLMRVVQADGGQVKLKRDELLFLRDAGLISITAEGTEPAGLFPVISDLLKEEHGE